MKITDEKILFDTCPSIAFYKNFTSKNKKIFIENGDLIQVVVCFYLFQEN